jgi:nitroimidazol reductase NimA-like FMN-containing flavoprotein (pyridoxamine 5'-phosphate oxidase superfamily)
MDSTRGTSLDHQGLEVIAPEECWQLLADSPVGRVAFNEAGEPMVLPVNHAVVGHRVVFRTLRGSLLHEALMAEPVAFQVDSFDVIGRTGWSVLVRGVADLAEDPEELEKLELHPWADSVEREDWVQIRAEEISGRRIVSSGS